MKNRNGKIARLPRAVREQLNDRLEHGEDGPRLLRWLNGLLETQELVRRKFAGVPVSKQNLSQWRRGGFQEALAWRYINQQSSDGVARFLTASLASLVCRSKRSAQEVPAVKNNEIKAIDCNAESYGKKSSPASQGG